MNFSDPTIPGTPSRMPALHSRASCRGFAVRNNRVVVFESHLELMVFFLLSCRPDVVEIIDQPPAIEFVDIDGQIHDHTFDFMVVLLDGTRIFIAVKPAAKVRKSGVANTIQQIAQQLPPGVADRILLITDKDFTRADRFNAQQGYECSRFPIKEHDEAIDRITKNMAGAVKIADLVDASGFSGVAFRAVIRLVMQGTLKVAQPHLRITPDSYVSRSEARWALQ